MAPKNRADLVRETKQEIGSSVRVYRKEWQWESRHDSEVEAWAHYEENFGGRLLPEDVTVHFETSVSRAPYFLMLRRWNVYAEWKTGELADRHVELLRQDDPEQQVEAVPRNSRHEHELKAYGVLKLPTGSR